MFWAKLFRFKQEPTEHYLIFVLLPFRFFFSFSAENQSSHQLASWWRIVPFLLVNQKFVQLPTCIDLSTCNKQKTKQKQKQTWREHRPDRFQFKKIRVFFFYCLLSKNKTKNLHGFGYLEVDYSMLLPKKHQLIGTSLANKHSNSNSSYSKVLMKIYFLHFLFDFTRTSHICSV